MKLWVDAESSEDNVTDSESWILSAVLQVGMQSIIEDLTLDCRDKQKRQRDGDGTLDNNAVTYTEITCLLARACMDTVMHEVLDQIFEATKGASENTYTSALLPFTRDLILAFDKRDPGLMDESGATIFCKNVMRAYIKKCRPPKLASSSRVRRNIYCEARRCSLCKRVKEFLSKPTAQFITLILLERNYGRVGHIRQ